MHKIVGYDKGGKLVLNEVNLSVPERGLLGARGFQVLDKTENGFVVPMFKLAAEKHYLFTMNALHHDNGTKRTRFVRPEELNREDRIRELVDSGELWGADHVLDNNAFLNNIDGESYAERSDVQLRQIVKKVFDARNKQFDCNSVIVFTNSGLGPSTTLEAKADGVIRDSERIGFGMRLNGEFSPAYVRGLEGSYQNTGKTHVHIIPMKGNVGEKIFNHFTGKLRAIHGVQQNATLKNYREMIKNIGPTDSKIGVISVAQVYDTSSPILFEHFSSCSLYPDAEERSTMSSLAGNIIREKYSELTGVNLDPKQDKAGVGELRKANSAHYTANIV